MYGLPQITHKDVEYFMFCQAQSTAVILRGVYSNLHSCRAQRDLGGVGKGNAIRDQQHH